MAGFVLTIGGVFLGQGFQADQAQAAPGAGELANQGWDPHWTEVPGVEARWLQPLSQESVYWTSDRSVGNPGPTVGNTNTMLGESYDFSDDVMSYKTRPVLQFERTATGIDPFIDPTGLQFSTQAMAPIGGTASGNDTLSMYFWAHDGTDHVAPSILDCGVATGRPANEWISVVRVTDDSPTIEVGCMPAPGGPVDFTNVTPGANIPFATGGEANQINGLVYIQADYGYLDSVPADLPAGGPNQNWVQFAVWDPQSGEFSLSGPVQPADTLGAMNQISGERKRLQAVTNGTTCVTGLENACTYGGAGMANPDAGPQTTADFGLDAQGSMYMIVASPFAAGENNNGTAALVRIRPARDEDGNIVDGTSANPWRYNVVKKLKKADPSVTYPNSGIYTPGTGIHDGIFLGGGYTSITSDDYPLNEGVAPGSTASINWTASRMVRVNPLSGSMEPIGPTSIEDNATTTDTLNPAGYVMSQLTGRGITYRDNASPQMLTVIEGHVYNDTNGDGAIEDPKGVAGVRVAIYSGDGTLLGSQATAQDGSYSLVVSGDGTYHVRVVQPQIDGVNAVQTWGSTINPEYPNAVLNSTQIHCVNGEIGPGQSQECHNALPVPFVDPALGEEEQTYDPSTWPTYATVTMTSNEEVGYADFGISTMGSYGDADVDPTEVADGAPAHVANNEATVWLGSELGRYAGPATDDSHASDDGLHLSTSNGDIPLKGSTLSATKVYQLSGTVSGDETASAAASAQAWTTTPGDSSPNFNSDPVWTSGVVDGVATGDFQVAKSGSYRTASQTWVRAQVSGQAITLPTNADGEYQAPASMTETSERYWATNGEIEDYSIKAIDSVVRPMVNTTAGSGQFKVNTTTLTADNTKVTLYPEIGGAAGIKQSLLFYNPDTTKWSVSKTDVTDTATGQEIDASKYVVTPATDGKSTTVEVTPAVGDDISVLVTYTLAPSAADSTLTLDKPSTTVNSPITATVTVRAADGVTLLPGQTVTFDNASDPTTTLSATTCVTSDKADASFGTCSVTITSAKAGTYTDELTASISTGEVDGSPATVTYTFDQGSVGNGELTVTPKATGSATPLTVGTADANKYTATAKVTDAAGNLAGGQTVTFAVVHAEDDSAVDSTKTTLTSATCVTSDKADDSYGTCSVDLSSTDDGSYKVSATVADPKDSTATVALTNSPVTVSYVGGSATADTVKLAVSPTASPIKDDVTATATATDQYGNVPGTATNVGFTVDGSAYFIEGVDSSDNGKATCTIPAGSSTCEVTLSDDVAEGVSVAGFLGSDEVVDSPITVNFANTAFSCTNSTYTVVKDPANPDSTKVAADGTQAWIGTLEARDASDAAMTNLTLADLDFTAAAPVVVSDPPVKNADGTYSVRYTSTKTGTYGTNVSYQGGCAVSANPDGSPKDLPVTFVAGPASGATSTIEATSPVTAGDPTGSTITVTLFDAHGNQLTEGGDTVAIQAVVPNSNPAQSFGTVSAVTDNGDGTYTATLTSAAPGNATVGFTVNGAAATDTASVVFTQGGVSAQYSSLWVVKSGQQTATQTAGSNVVVGVTAHDVNDLPITTLTSDQFDLSGVADGVPDLEFTYAGPGTNPGEYLFNTTSELKGTFTLSATVDSVALTQHPSVEFTSGAVCVANCTPVDNPKTPEDESKENKTHFWVSADGAIANGQATDEISASAYDTYGNPVSEAEVVLTDQTSGALQGKLNPATGRGTTNDDGLAKITFTSTAVGTYTVSGEVDDLTPADGSGVLNPSFVSDQVSAKDSTLTVLPATNEVGTSATAKVTTVDRNKNKVGGVLVTLTGSSPNLTIDGKPTTASCTTSDVEDDPDFGTCSVPVSSKIADTYTVTGTIGSETVGSGAVSVTFTPGDVCFTDCTPVDDPTTPIDESEEHFTGVKVTKDGAAANGVDDDQATAYAYDEYGNPVVDVIVNTTAVTSTLTAPSAPAKTNDEGEVVLSYTSTVAGEAQARVFIDSVEPKDSAKGDSPVTMHFGTGKGDPTQSDLTIAPTTPQPVDSIFQVTATVRDATRNLVTGAVVSFDLEPGSKIVLTDPVTGAAATTCTTGDSGTCVLNATSTIAGSYQIGATIPNASGIPIGLNGSPVKAQFTAGDLCLESEGCVSDPGVAKSSVSMTKNGALNDGQDSNTATVEAYDKHGNPIQGAEVTSAQVAGETGLTVVTPIKATDADGRTTISYTSLVGGEPLKADVTVTKDDVTGAPEGSPVTMRFSAVPADADQSEFTVIPKIAGTPTPLTVGEADLNTYEVKATIRDENRTPVVGAVVSFDITPDGTTWVNDDASCTSGAGGVCSAFVTSTKAGTFAVTASLGSDSIQQAKPAVWVADDVCAVGCDPVDPTLPTELRTRVEVTHDNEVADGVARDIATVYTFDQYGNPVSSVVAKAAAKAPDTAETLGVQPGIAGTDEDGVTTIWFRSTKSGAHQADITVDTDDKIPAGSPVTLNFKAGPANAKNSTLVLDATSAPVGGTITGTVTTKDAKGNLVGGAQVTLGTDGSASVNPSSCRTSEADDATFGTCTLSVTDEVAETVPVTAMIDVLGSPTPITGSGEEVTFVADAVVVDPSKSTFVVDPVTDPADRDKVGWPAGDGSGIYTATVTLRDADEVAVDPQNVDDLVFDSSETAVVISSVERVDVGQYKVTYTYAGGDNATATADASFAGAQIGTDLPIPFHGVPSNDCPTPGMKSGLSVDKATAVVPGPITATALITDKDCRPVPNAKVSFALSTPGSATLDPDTEVVYTDGDGRAVVKVSDTVPETVTLTASNDALGELLGSPKDLKFTNEISDVPPVITEPTDGSVTNDLPLTVAGTGHDGSTVTVTDETGKTQCTALVVDGQWSCDDVELRDGEHTLTATQEDPTNGHVSDPSEPVNVTIDTVAPDAPVIDTANDETIGGTVPAPVDPGTTVTVTYPTADGVKTVEDVPVNQDGSWSTPTPSDAVDGEVAAVATDPAGNVSPEATHPLDVTPPDAPVIDTANQDQVAGTVPGPVDEGTTVDVTWPDGTVTKDVPVDDEGRFQVDTPQGMPSGEVSAVATDPAGNQSDPGTAALDTVDPGNPVIDTANDDTIGGTVPAPIDKDTTITVTYPTADGAKTIEDVPVDPDGSWSTPTPDDAIDGDVSAVATDPAGNESEPGEGVLDVTPPEAPVVDKANDDVISGTVPGDIDPGTEVEVTYPKADGSQGSATVPVDPDGSWTMPTPDDAVDGSIQAVATDPAGNDSEPGEGVLDRTAPGKPDITQANDEVIEGTVPTPVEDGTMVEVTYPKADGSQGSATVPVDPDGSWTIPTPDDAVDGPIQAVATDPAGNDSEPDDGLLDRTGPATPVVDNGNADEVTGHVPEPVEPGTTVDVTWPDGSVTEDVPVGEDGNFTAKTPDGMESGTVEVVATDPAGNPSGVGRGDLDTEAPGKPQIDTANDEIIEGSVPMPVEDGTMVEVTYPTAGGGQGSATVPVDPDGSWSLPTPDDAVDGPVEAVATDPAGNESEPGEGVLDRTPPETPVIEEANGDHVTGQVPGENNPGTTVDITWPDGSVTEDVPVDDDGAFEVDTPEGMPSGPIEVVATDPAGNDSDPGQGQINTDANGAPVIDTANGDNVAGSVPGPVEDGTTVDVTYPTADGTRTVTDVPVDPEGNWSIETPDDAVNGTVKAVAVDPAGNSSPEGTAHLDVVDPDKPVVDDANKDHVTGHVPGDNDPGTTVDITWPDGSVAEDVPVDDDGNFEIDTPEGMGSGPITVVATDPAGNQSEPGKGDLDTTPPADPTIDTANNDVISGTVPGEVDPGTTVEVKDDDGNTVCTATVGEDGKWSCLTPDGVKDGPITAVATDPAGNPSNPTPGYLDATAPDAPVIDHANDSVIDGQAEPGSTVTVTYPKNDGSTGTVGPITVSPEGDWSIPTPDDAKDGGQISAVATDEAGNVSEPDTAILDRTPPTKPDASSPNGTEVIGKGDPGDTATVTDPDGKPLPGCEATVIGVDGTWSCTPTDPLQPGDKVTVVVTDPAGNQSEPTVVTVGSLQIEVAYPTRNPGQTEVVTGSNFNPGERVCLVVHSTGVDLGCQTADKDGKVTFSFTVGSELAVGTHTVTLTGEKSGSVSAVFSVTTAISVATGGTMDYDSSFPYALLVGGSVMVFTGLWLTSKKVARGRR
ncbi:MAG: Ig-like domain-containing protein [Propionibacteriaceae bacterium]|jgi:hypothetical protein|nr:Ig-like domain-containing protein [Propionibacteriaceae bacterium]